MSGNITDDSETAVNNFSSEDDEYESERDSDCGEVQLNAGDHASIPAPYDDEPILAQGETEQELEDEVDIDGIRISILQERFGNAIPTNEWYV